MSVAGMDMGDQKNCIAVARKRGIDVLMNKESKRETPSLVSFGPKQRQLGTDAVGSLSISPRNTIFGIKLLLGKKFSNPQVQEVIKKLPYSVTEGPDGGILVNVDYLGERHSFTPEQIVAALIVDMKTIAEVDGSPVTDCVISVPAYFLESERYAMLNAAQIAGVNCLRLLNDTTAAALAYGIYKTDLPEAEPVNVAFIDCGYNAFQVSIVAFKKGQLRVLSHAWDRQLGGRALDDVLFDHFAAEFQAKHGLDVRTNPRAAFRLRMGTEKLKKVLSSIPEAPLSVECLMNDIDFRSSMTREKFEEMAGPVLDLAKAPVKRALEDAKLSLDDIASVEVTGGSSRVPALITHLRDFFGKEPSRTLNATEVVSRGCALNCAMLSPIFRVRDFEIIDIYPYGIAFSWDKDGEPTSSVLFERNGPIPSAKMLTFFRNTSFSLTAAYTEDSPVPEGFDRTIGVFEVGPPAKVPQDGSKAKIKVKVKLNLHGLVTVEHVQQIEEEEYEETVKKAPAAKVDDKKDEPMPDASAAGPTENGSPAAAESSGGEPSAADDAAGTPMETEEKEKAAAPMETTEVVKKKRVKKLPVPLKAQIAGLSSKAVQDFIEAEGNMELQKRRQEETNEKKNAVEAFVYSLRGKLADSLAPFATDAEASRINEVLQATEDWLYEEGEDETKAVYVAKLEELQALGGPVLARQAEAEARPAAAASLQAVATRYQAAAASNDPAYAHIPQDERQKVLEEARKAVEWLREKLALQERCAKTDDPAVLAADIRKREDTVVRFCDPIMSRAPPPPPKEEKKEPKADAHAEAKAEAMDTDADAQADAAAAGADASADAGRTPIVEEPMVD